MPDQESLIKWCIPPDIDLNNPYLYFIKVISDAKKEYRYIGKASSKKRIKAYGRNVSRILKGEPSRPLIKENGERQSDGNIKYRHVHLVLANAVKKGWHIECRLIINCPTEQLAEMEQQYIKEYDCNMNEGESWFIEEFEEKSKKIR